MARTSAVPGFYKLSPAERLEIVKEFASLSDEEAEALGGFGALGGETANRMIENVIGSFPLPLGVAANFKVNGEELFVPMALEEPSVVAAASHMAKGTLPAGIAAETDDPVMIGQIQLVDLDDAFAAASEATSYRTSSYTAQDLSSSLMGVDTETEIDEDNPTTTAEVSPELSHITMDLSALRIARGISAADLLAKQVI